MPSNYPGSLDSLSTSHVFGEIISETIDNDQADAINKIEAELGTNPSGAQATVDARIGLLETNGVLDGDAAGGDLSGTYPNPQIGSGVIVNADVNAGAAIAESKLNLATDAAAGTGSRRTLGTGAQQAAAGNDSRLSDSRNPTGPAGGVLSGTYPNPGFAADMATQAELDAHEADTTSVHGIANTANLLKSGDAAGGVLSGTYPNPGFAVDMATQAELDAAIAGVAAGQPSIATLAKIGMY